MALDRTHQLHLKTLWCDSWDIQVKVYLMVSRHYPAQPFCLVLVLAFELGNAWVACICAWHHFLGVWLYSNYTIGHQNFERVLCLILPSHLVKSVSSASILRCQSVLWECVSRRGLLHYSEGSVFVLRKYWGTESFPTTKEWFQNDKGEKSKETSKFEKKYRWKWSFSNRTRWRH